MNFSNRYSFDDQLTPVFIFERLCNIIFPEETDTGEFFMTLEKDPQQEDFLQGRMLGNPYSSNDPDLGPNMREIKNKICTDCELVALLEDDNGTQPAKVDLNKKSFPKQKTIQKFTIGAQGLRKAKNDNPPTWEMGVAS